MDKHITKKTILAACIALGGMYACSDMDEYKDLYLKDGIQSYTGKIDSVKVYSGHERVMIEGLFMSDPKVTGCMIYWNSKMDSVDIPVTRTDNVDTLRQIIDLPENLYNFEIYTYDQYGNRSVPVYATGDSYGSNFISQLINRPLRGDAASVADSLIVRFLPVDQTLGPIHTVVSFTDAAGKADTVHVTTEQEQLVIHDYTPGSPFTYWTEYVPDTLCIDTFKSVVSEVIQPIKRISGVECIGFSSEEADSEADGKQGHASQTVDGDINTYWHSEHTPNRPNYPHYLEYDMKQVHTVPFFEVVGRIGAASQFKEFEIYGKTNAEDEWKLIQRFTHSNYQNGEVERFTFDQPATMRYVKINMVNGHTGDPYTFLAEFWLYE